MLKKSPNPAGFWASIPCKTNLLPSSLLRSRGSRAVLWTSSKNKFSLENISLRKFIISWAQHEGKILPGLSRPGSQNIPKNIPKNNPKGRLWSHLPPNLHLQVFCSHPSPIILVLIFIFPNPGGYSRAMVGFFPSFQLSQLDGTRKIPSRSLLSFEIWL